MLASICNFTAFTTVKLWKLHLFCNQSSSRKSHPCGNCNKLPVSCKQEGSHRLAGLSRAVVLDVCAQQAQQLQAFKLARWAHTQLQTLRLPSSWQVRQPRFAWSHSKRAAGNSYQAGCWFHHPVFPANTVVQVSCVNWSRSKYGLQLVIERLQSG